MQGYSLTNLSEDKCLQWEQLALLNSDLWAHFGFKGVFGRGPRGGLHRLTQRLGDWFPSGLCELKVGDREWRWCPFFTRLFPRRGEEKLGHQTVELEKEYCHRKDPGGNIGARGEEHESMEDVERQAQQD